MFKYLNPFRASKHTNQLVFLITVSTIVVSIVLVYLLKYMLGSVYNFSSFVSSVTVPLLVVPPSIYMIVNLSTNLEKYKTDLEIEIEENKKKDLILFEQARFVLMGEMMANISHQWKQPLNNVALAILSSRLDDSEENREKNFDIMEENINYLSSTIDDFMSFFENKSPKEARSIVDIIDEVKSIMKAQIESRGIKLTLNIDDKLKTTNMTPIISQVLLNLLNNAKDAIDETKSDKEIILYFKALPNGLQISCCDNGSGVDEEIKTKIFDPYFTTKIKKQGTGIGLYMSKQIINNVFSGSIVLDDISKNTCFRIDIPSSKNCQLKPTLEDKSV